MSHPAELFSVPVNVFARSQRMGLPCERVGEAGMEGRGCLCAHGRLSPAPRMGWLNQTLISHSPAGCGLVSGAGMVGPDEGPLAGGALPWCARAEALCLPLLEGH